MESWMPYLLTVTPGLLLVALVAVLLPRQAHGVRILVLILGVVFARDAMTTHGLWEMGIVGGNGAGSGAGAGRGDGAVAVALPLLWLRFTDELATLLVLAVASLALAAGVVLACRDLRWTVLWSGPRWWVSVLAGLAGMAVIVVPFLWLYGTLGTWFPALAGGPADAGGSADAGGPAGPGVAAGAGVVPLDERGGAVAAGLLVLLAVVALCGTLVEEVLFRGFLQAHLEDASPGRTGRWRAALLSGLLFAAAHLALAYHLTDLGWPVVAFTLFVGLVCAVVAMRQGVLGATVAHGGAIFLLSSGLV